MTTIYDPIYGLCLPFVKAFFEEFFAGHHVHNTAATFFYI